MGAKTGLVAFTDGDLPAALCRATLPDRDEMAELVRRVLPGYGLEYAGTGRLGDAVTRRTRSSSQPPSARRRSWATSAS
jgi:hypothetical protein